MKYILILFVAFAMMISLAQSQPVSSRQKRATCDLFSVLGVNHTLCAAHCLGHGFKGGYCNDKAICICRK
ncbi:defensin-like [Drosophila tropicalis]|uniref:defensin-like n=1 Tax=Drosophila tropicalis TaxID=46794 RepID=UPI0035ABB5A7